MTTRYIAFSPGFIGFPGGFPPPAGPRQLVTGAAGGRGTNNATNHEGDHMATISLRLEDLEIERNEEPFEFEFPDGAKFIFKSPKGVSGSALLSFELLTPAEEMGAILGDDFDAFMAHEEVDGYFIEALLPKYMAHFGLIPEGGE